MVFRVAFALTAAARRIDSGSHRASCANESSAVHARSIATLALLACLAIATAQAADDTPAAPDAKPDVKRTGNVLKLRKTAPAEDPAPTIESFVQLAKGQNIDAIYKTFGDVPVQANGEMALKHYLATEVVPFFADADRLEGAWRVVGATFEDDSTGQIAYAYIVTKGGQVKPFTIAWRVEHSRAKLMDVKVDRCVKARHPVTPGGCER